MLRCVAGCGLTGTAWLMAATVAHAGATPREAALPELAAQAAVPQLMFAASEPSDDWAGAGAGSSAGVAAGQIPAVPSVGSDWSFTISPYLWMAGIKSSTTFTPRGTNRILTGSVDADFSDILSDLNFAIMAGAEARRGSFSAQVDAIYMDILQKGSTVSEVTGPLGRREIPIDLGGKLRLKTTVWTLSAGYDIFRDERGFVQLYGGLRYLGAKSTLDWNFQGPLGDLARAGRVKSQDDIWNGVAGLRGERALGAGRWKAIYYVDVGAGDSDLTWQASAQLGYAQRWGDVGLGWRYLEFKQSSRSGAADLTLSGPIATVRYRFGGP